MRTERLPDVELRHLRYFVKVAELRHFGRAAEALHMSQPPLSRQIQDLEFRIGTRLLDRSSRGVTLTQAGSVFVIEARRILGEVSVSIQKVRRAAAGGAE